MVNDKKMWVFIVGLVVLCAVVIFWPKNNMTSTTNGQTTQPVSQTPAPAGQATGLKIKDEVVGTGAEAVNGKQVTVDYVGTLTTGEKFDSSYDRNQPFQFVLGSGQVIKGWDLGVLGMKVGGKRKLTIPGDLAYGPSGAGGLIGPNATLVFEVELLGVQ